MGGGAADPGAEPQISPQQRGYGDPPGRTLDRPVRVATIAVGEVRVIARLERDAQPGDEAALSLDRGAPVAR